jgi:multiple sugar transport system substrate-binding protein
MSRTQMIIIGLGVILVTVVVLVLAGVIPGLRRDTTLTPVRLEVWGVFDSQSEFAGVFDSYQKTRPNVSIRYREFSPDTYETELVDALAAGSGPDVFMFHNSWLPKHASKLASAAANQFTLSQLQDLFPRVVEQDFAPDGTVYALPLYIDTLALIYNKDIFDKKAVAVPARDWTEFQNQILKIRELDRRGNITLAASAIGGSMKSVNRAPDLLSALMLQTGTEMVSNDFTSATFAREEGRDALRFYTQFADPAHKYYTWNDELHYSLDAFSEGSTAMIFNYQYNLRTLREKNPFLRIGVAELPQINPNSRVDYPNYFGLAVSRQSRNAQYGWDLITFLTTRPEVSKRYLAATKHPPALRSIINERLNDPEVGVFARQALSARSWPQVDNAAIDRIFSGMIEDVIYGRLELGVAISQAQAEMTDLMRRRR